MRRSHGSKISSLLGQRVCFKLRYKTVQKLILGIRLSVDVLPGGSGVTEGGRIESQPKKAVSERTSCFKTHVK